MLIGIEMVCMVRMATRREKAEEMDDNALCPKILKRMQALRGSTK